MKTHTLVILSGLLSMVAPLAFAQGGVVNSTKNPLQIALLHWNKSNQAVSFPVGTGPQGIAFDGASIWVANFSNNTVSKLTASDGTVLNTVSVPGQPYGMAFDGANIWVSNFLNGTVTALQASGGAVVGSFTVGTNPEG